MPYNFFKQLKYRCNICKDIILSNSDTEWTTCSCGALSILGNKSFVKVNSKTQNYTDMSIYNKDDLPKFVEPELKEPS